MTFVTKDSGAREEYASGMRRDVEEGKARFDLLLPDGVPYAEQLLTRLAELMARGAVKYGDRNWEQASGQAELDRFRSSAIRHLQQWATGETDEDHAAAVMFNLLGYETTRWKIAAAERGGWAAVTQMFDAIQATGLTAGIVEDPRADGCPICLGTGVQHCGMSACRKDEGGAGSDCGKPCDCGKAMAEAIAAGQAVRAKLLTEWRAEELRDHG